MENLGDGQFSIRALPMEAQLGPLYGLVSTDATGNGYLDVLAVGNSYAPDVITGRHDALVGVLLEGDGQGRFEAVSHRDSGFFVDGDAKGLARLYDDTGTPMYLATQNDDSTRVFRQVTNPDHRTLSVSARAAYAEIVFSDGTIQRRELYYGNGYLSQSSRRLRVPTTAREVTIVTYSGQRRTVRDSSTTE